MSAPTVHLMTTADLLALPDDGKERYLIDGELREIEMTRRSRRHGRTEARIAQHLCNWVDRQPEPRGEVEDGDVGFRIRQDPDTTVGIDVAYISAELARITPEDAAIIDGVPILAVEVLSPSNTHEQIAGKVQSCLAAGVLLVWVVDPVFRTVTVYRPGAEPELFNARQELVGDPHLPGLRIPVAALFGT
jgi:Uma2 family endonuclease